MSRWMNGKGGTVERREGGHDTVIKKEVERMKVNVVGGQIFSEDIGGC